MSFVTVCMSPHGADVLNLCLVALDPEYYHQAILCCEFYAAYSQSPKTHSALANFRPSCTTYMYGSEVSW